MPALGVIFHPTFPPETLADFARRAESGGFDELWLWDDCFLPGALTSAAIALAATSRIKVGIGLIPAKAYHPLFAAMEITTLARAFPDRLIAGFGHGVGTWMTQIGATSKSSLRTLQETVVAVRALLGGERVTTHGEYVNLEGVSMDLIPAQVPPLYIGAMREESLQLAGQIGDGTILTAISSPEYVRWARQHVDRGVAQSGRANRIAVFVHCKVSHDGQAARDATRAALAKNHPWADVHIIPTGLTGDIDAFMRERGADRLGVEMPDAWLDQLAAAGRPEQAAAMLMRLASAGADSIILQPLNGDSACLDE